MTPSLQPLAVICLATLVPVAVAEQWPQRQRDMSNTGRADFPVPEDRLGPNFFNVLRWQTRTPESPNYGAVSSGSMVFYDGAGPGGSDLVVGCYHWPKGVQGMDRHTGKLFWQGNPAGGEQIGANTPAFSPDGDTIYVSTDTPPPLMAFGSVVGPSVHWDNGSDPEPMIMGFSTPKVAPDGRLFSNCDRPRGATDFGTSLSITWTATSSVCSMWYGGVALHAETGLVTVVGSGRCGLLRAYHGDTGEELWTAEVGLPTDMDPTIDPANGNIYLPVGFDSVAVAGMTKNGEPLWSSTTQPVFTWTNGVNHPQRGGGSGCLAHDGATYYFQTVSEVGDGQLYAIRTVDGSVKWSYPTQSRGWENGRNSFSAPIVTPNGVIVIGNNENSMNFALQDTGDSAVLLDTLQIATNGRAVGSATLSADGLLYLPARLPWIQSNGDGDTPTRTIQNLFNAFDLRSFSEMEMILPAPDHPRGHPLNGANQVKWNAVEDPLGFFSHYAIFRASAPFASVAGLAPIGTVSDRLTLEYTDNTAENGTGYYYGVTAVSLSGHQQTNLAECVGPLRPWDETDLQVVTISRTPRFPRYTPQYIERTVTEPSGYGPYLFLVATNMGPGQTPATPRWPTNSESVTYTATIRNRGSNPWPGPVHGTWTWDGEPAGSSALPDPLAPGALATTALMRPWDGEDHLVQFTLLDSDARTNNNSLTITAKSVAFLTYMDETAYEECRVLARAWPNARTDDLIDFLNFNMARFNQMFAKMEGAKRAHYDVMEILPDGSPDPDVDRRLFAIFPFRRTNGLVRYTGGYYNAGDDIDYGLLHEQGHQLGLIDIYQLNVTKSMNKATGEGYGAYWDLMNGVSPFLSHASFLPMQHWLDQAHGYFGQYLYCLPAEIGLRILDTNGQPLSNALIQMYQRCHRPTVGDVISTQLKAEDLTDTNGIWILPNVPIDPDLAPPAATGDELRDNPFGYVDILGRNGLLHFQVVAKDETNYTWLSVLEANIAWLQGQTNRVVFDRLWSARTMRTPVLLGPPRLNFTTGACEVLIIGEYPYDHQAMDIEVSSDLMDWTMLQPYFPSNGLIEFSDPNPVSPRFYRTRQ